MEYNKFLNYFPKKYLKFIQLQETKNDFFDKVLSDRYRSDLVSWMLKNLSSTQSMKYKEVALLLYDKISDLPFLNQSTQKIILLTSARITYKLLHDTSSENIDSKYFLDIINNDLKGSNKQELSISDMNETEIFILNYFNWNINRITISDIIYYLLNTIKESINQHVENKALFMNIINYYLEISIIAFRSNLIPLHSIAACIILMAIDQFEISRCQI